MSAFIVADFEDNESDGRLNGNENTSPRPPLLSKADFLKGFTPPDSLIKGILQRRFVYSFTGRTGDGKTAIALLLARLVSDRSEKNPMLGRHRVKHGTVIYFAGENPDDLRMRMIAEDLLANRDGSADTIEVIPGTFEIDAMLNECKTWCETNGTGIDLVIVDTSAAYFFGQDENNNPQMGAHARKLRALTALPGGPCVLVLCHPIKNATEPAHLLPRGGGAFIAEVDGNLTAWRTDELTELYWHGKIRGPGFEPIAFRLEKITCPELVDGDGEALPTVRAVPVSDNDQENLTRAARKDEDVLLIALLEPGRSVAQLAAACEWQTPSGEPYKSKIQRRIAGLEKSGLVRKARGVWELTDKGKTAASTAANSNDAAKPSKSSVPPSGTANR